MQSLGEFIKQRIAVNREIVNQIAGSTTIEKKCVGKEDNLCKLVMNCVLGEMKNDSTCRESLIKFNNLRPNEINDKFGDLPVREKVKLIKLLKFRDANTKAEWYAQNQFPVKTNENLDRLLDQMVEFKKELFSPTGLAKSSAPRKSIKNYEEVDGWKKYGRKVGKGFRQEAVALYHNTRQRLDRSSALLKRSILAGGGLSGGASAAFSSLLKEKQVHLGATLELMLKNADELVKASGNQLEGKEQMEENIEDLKELETLLYSQFEAMEEIIRLLEKTGTTEERVDASNLKATLDKLREAHEKKRTDTIKRQKDLYDVLAKIYQSPILAIGI